MLTLRPFSQGIVAGGLCQPLTLSFCIEVCHPATCTYVRLLGPCFKTGETKPFCSVKLTPAQISLCQDQPYGTTQATAPWTQANKTVWHSLHWFCSLPFQQFQVLFNSLFKVLCIFPSRYLCSIGLSLIFSLRWNLPPFVLQSQTKLLDSPSWVSMTYGSITLFAVLFQGTWSNSLCTETTIQSTDSHFGLFPFHSPLHGKSLLVSFPPLINMLKFSGFPCLIWDQSFGIQLHDCAPFLNSLFLCTQIVGS